MIGETNAQSAALDAEMGLLQGLGKDTRVLVPNDVLVSVGRLVTLVRERAERLGALKPTKPSSASSSTRGGDGASQHGRNGGSASSKASHATSKGSGAKRKPHGYSSKFQPALKNVRTPFFYH